MLLEHSNTVHIKSSNNNSKQASESSNNNKQASESSNNNNKQAPESSNNNSKQASESSNNNSKQAPESSNNNKQASETSQSSLNLSLFICHYISFMALCCPQSLDHHIGLLYFNFFRPNIPGRTVAV